MKILIRSLISGLLVAGLAASGLAFRGAHQRGVDVTLTPDATSGVTIDPTQPYDLTLGLTGAPSTTYALAVAYTDGSAQCTTPATTLTTDANGSASFDCLLGTTWSAALNSASVTFAVAKDGLDLGSVTALFTLQSATPVVSDSPTPTPDPTESSSPDASTDNHGQCVSYWAHTAKAAGLLRSNYGHFVSMVARSDCQGADPSAFATQLAAAVAAQNASTASSSSATGTHGDHGKHN